MYKESPLCKRCCCCVPLRYGLIIFAYIKLILASLVVVGAYYKSHYIVSENQHLVRNITIAIFMLDVIFSLVFIVGCHKKNEKLLKIYYFYAIYFTVLIVTHSVYRIVYFSYDVISHNYYKYLGILDLWFFSLILLVIVWHIYITILVRSEFITLRNTYQFKFENHATEAECTLDLEQQDETNLIQENKINLENKIKE